MRTPTRIAILAALALACAPEGRVVRSGGPSIREAQQERYDGPKARVSVAAFEDKALDQEGRRRARGADLHGVREMLAASLFRTGRYIVIERQNVSQLVAVQGWTAATKPSSDPEVQLEGVELLVVGAITGFEENVMSVGGALANLATLGTYGAFGGAGTQVARIAMDVRMIDSATGRVLAATSVAGTSQSGEATAAARDGSVAAGAAGGVSGPVDSALREAAETAVAHFVSRTPVVYYRY